MDSIKRCTTFPERLQCWTSTWPPCDNFRWSKILSSCRWGRLSGGWEAMMNRPVPGVQALVPWSFVAWVRIIRPLWNFKNTSWPTNRSNMKSHESNTSWKFSDSFFLLIFWKGYVSVPSSREKRWSQWSWWREKREKRKKRKRLQKRWGSWDRRGCCCMLFLNDTCEIWVLTSMPPLQNLSFHEFSVMLFRLLKLCFGWSWGGNLWVVWPPKYFKCQVGDANVEASETGSNPNELPDLPEDLEEEPFASLHPSLRIWRWNDREISLRILLVWCFGFHYTSCCELIHSAAWVWTHGPFLHGICQGGTKDADKDTNHARPQSPKSGHAQFDSIIHHWTDALVVECSVKWSRCACGKSAVCGVSKISKGWGWGRRTVNSGEQWDVAGCCSNPECINEILELSKKV